MLHTHARTYIWGTEPKDVSRPIRARARETCVGPEDKPALDRQPIEERGELKWLYRPCLDSHFHCRSVAYVWPCRSGACHGGKHEQSLIFSTRALHFPWCSLG